ALENARLYQQQKRFADTMQRSLLPRVYPKIDGIELGDVYESSARLDVGGDVYDFLTLNDGRLAVALGDVTGHGIDAAADMAMAKFVFRSLAREHPEPGDFLAAANHVVVGEVAPNKFITMLYLTVDPATGAVACGCAGHPWPRLVRPSGDVTALEASGLALGIDPGQSYDELREQLPAGGALVLYTDGVIEARRDVLLEVSHGVAAGRVRPLRLEELREVAPELPTLEQALEFFASEGVGLHADVKSPRHGREIAAALRRHGLVERAVASSFWTPTLCDLRSE